MTSAFVGACERRGVTGDVMTVRDEATILDFEDGALVEATQRTSSGTSLRVLAEGTWGWAGTSDDAADADGLLDGALLSAGLGEQVDAFLPLPAPLPIVATADDDTATMPMADLQGVVTALTSRLKVAGGRVTVTLERALGEVAVANTRGVDARYDTTFAALAVRLQVPHDDGIATVRTAYTGVALPTDADLEVLVADVEQRLRWGARPASVPRGGAVLLLPRALRQVLRPLERALLGSEASAAHGLAGALGEQRFAAAVNLEDAPHLPGRPGSRPIDDDGVVTRTVALIEDGVVARLLTDLVSGARLQRPSTGSAWRTMAGPSRPGFSNLVIQPGSRDLAGMLAAVGTGLLVDEVASGAGAVSASGAFRFPVASGFQVERGEVTGRVEGMAISGNTFDLLARVEEVGVERRWVGSAHLPSLLALGVDVGAR